MSLKDAVRFRKLSTQLTKEETNSFLSHIVGENPQFLISCMCSHFISESTDRSLATNINNTISSIINSRKTKPETKVKSQQRILKRKFDEIPKPLISNVASYLKQTEYVNLCQVNRDIFIGCNSPQSLQNIYFECESNVNYFQFNSDLYPSVQHLHFDLSQYDHRLKEITHQFLNQLESIIFSGNHPPDDLCIYALEDIPVSRSIQKLYLQYWQNEMGVSDSLFQRFLSKFPNIKYLQLNSVRGVAFDCIKSLFPELKGLSVSSGLDGDTRKYAQLIEHFGQELEYLSLDEVDSFCDPGFGKLKQLQARDIATNSLNDIIHSAGKLEKVDMSFINFEGEGDMTWERVAMELIKCCPCLEYISIYDLDEEAIVQLLNGIEKGLEKTKEKNRNVLKIKIETRDQRYDWADLISCVLRLRDRMKNIRVNDYMFIWKMPSKYAKETERYFGKDLLVTDRRYWSIFVVQNDGCKINGYGESWMM